MTSVGCFVNPANANQLIVFVCDSNNNLGLFTADATKTGPVINPENGDDDPIFTTKGVQGLLAHPGQLVVCLYNSLISVYSVLNSNNALALFSPGLILLDAKASATVSWLAGCSDGNQDAWLYYFADVTNNNVTTQALTEYRVQEQSSVQVTPSALATGSILAAAYDPTKGQRYYLYQNTSNGITIVARTQGGDNETPIHPLNFLTTGAAFAACCNPQVGKMVIYFMVGSAGNQSLNRISWNLGNTFSAITTVSTGGNKVDQTSWLSVTADKEATHLCYTSSGAGQHGVYHLREQWTDI